MTTSEDQTSDERGVRRPDLRAPQPSVAASGRGPGGRRGGSADRRGGGPGGGGGPVRRGRPGRGDLTGGDRRGGRGRPGDLCPRDRPGSAVDPGAGADLAAVAGRGGYAAVDVRGLVGRSAAAGDLDRGRRADGRPSGDPG